MNRTTKSVATLDAGAALHSDNDVGKALGKGFVTLGHDVKMGSRDAKNEKALAWAKEVGAKASAGTLEPGIQAPKIKPE